MAKNYFYNAVLLFFLFSMSLSAQDTKQRNCRTSLIEGLNLYPNPVSNGKVYVSTKMILIKNYYLIF
jgi:hypothetical protein